MAKTSKKPVTARGELTRQKLLAAAESEFGEKGFHTASVSSITRRAGVAQGTFYIYYSSKEEILRELVRFMSRKLRHALTEATRGVSDRIEIERLGLLAFLKFAVEDKNLYRVVLESQFIDESIYREYYEHMANMYQMRLERAQQAGQIRKTSAYGQAWALMGIGSFLGLRYGVWEDRVPPDDVIEAALAFIRGGLMPEEATRQALS
ncbi:MAG: TetR/AcrR family transcriptional regulator [Ectothiorhodospiraceae bacterium]|nr:TetR/AcrR family transcriptional regulator [Paracoccaceae bacterium]MCH8505134.1 TetR/AcrR family transcriptional regulator [Ectothiorhodospiraceae bacterium]